MGVVESQLSFLLSAEDRAPLVARVTKVSKNMLVAYVVPGFIKFNIYTRLPAATAPKASEI
jgi:hypothetical protein